MGHLSRWRIARHRSQIRCERGRFLLIHGRQPATKGAQTLPRLPCRENWQRWPAAVDCPLNRAITGGFAPSRALQQAIPGFRTPPERARITRNSEMSTGNCDHLLAHLGHTLVDGATCRGTCCVRALLIAVRWTSMCVTSPMVYSQTTNVAGPDAPGRGPSGRATPGM